MKGTLYGLGIGPGDPELITLKALRILRRTSVLAYPAPEAGESLARSIVAGHLDGHHREVCIRMPMVAARFPAQEVYDRAAVELGGHLDAGRDVAVLCEGDPFFYGSFMYMFGRMAAHHAVEVVPGVFFAHGLRGHPGRAPGGAQRRAHRPPGHPVERSAGAAHPRGRRGGRHQGRPALAKGRAVIEAMGLIANARYVERATMENEKILPLADVDEDEVPYFSMILLHARGDAWNV